MISKEQDTQPIILDGHRHFTHDVVHDYIRQLEYELEVHRGWILTTTTNAVLDRYYSTEGRKRIKRTFHT